MRTPFDQHPAQNPQAYHLQEEAKTMTDEITAASAKLMPPAAVAAAEPLFGVTLQNWVLIAALIYSALQIVVLIRNEFIRKRKK